jgi:hypothetical protein
MASFRHAGRAATPCMAIPPNHSRGRVHDVLRHRAPQRLGCSSTAPASLTKVSVPADALVAAVATAFTFALIALTSKIKSPR